MKTILEKAKKWFAASLSEVPAFRELCKVVVRLITKSVKKEDASADKFAFDELRAKTKNAQIAVGGALIVLVTVLFMLGHGDSHSRPESGIIHADADMRKAILAQLEQERRRAARAEVEQREAELKRAEKEAAREAAEESRKRKHEELGAWYRSERKRLEERKKDELSKLEKAKNNRAHDILVEHNWPQIKFPFLDDIIIADLLPEKYRSYALTECPITIKDIPIFTSMRIDGAQVDGIVNGIRLEGRVPMTVETAIDWMQKLSRKLDAAWSIKHMNLGKDQIFPDGGHEIAGRSWKGLPEWHALFQCQVHKTDDGQIAKFTLDIDSYDLPRLVREQLDKEYWKSVEKFEADFKAQEERLGNELHRKQKEVK